MTLAHRKMGKRNRIWKPASRGPPPDEGCQKRLQMAQKQGRIATFQERREPYLNRREISPPKPQYKPVAPLGRLLQVEQPPKPAHR